MGTLVEASVIVHAPFTMEDDDSNIRMTSLPNKEDDRDSVIDMHPAEREHSFIKQNGHIIQNGRMPLTIDTSLEESDSKLDETPKGSPSDTDSGFEKCLNSPTGSPVSSKSDSSSCSGGISPSVVIDCDPNEDTGDETKTAPNVIQKRNTKAKSSNNNSTPKGILKNRNIISEGFVNLAFDASDEEVGNRSRPSSLIAHEMALSVNSHSDKLENTRDTLPAGTLDTQHITAKLQSPLDLRARQKRQHKMYWILLAFVVLLIVAAAIVIPILWLTQDKENNGHSGSSSNSTVIPQKARL